MKQVKALVINIKRKLQINYQKAANLLRLKYLLRALILFLSLSPQLVSFVEELDEQFLFQRHHWILSLRSSASVLRISASYIEITMLKLHTKQHKELKTIQCSR